jgi:hypothetical protein
MRAQAILPSTGTRRHGLVLRAVTLLLALALLGAPLLQTGVTLAMVEECGKPLPIIEEEVHKSIAPPAACMPDAPSSGVLLRSDPGHGALPSPLREVISPPPERA